MFLVLLAFYIMQGMLQERRCSGSSKSITIFALSIKNGPSLSSFASPNPSFCEMPTQKNCHEHVSDGDESPTINERFLLSSG